MSADSLLNNNLFKTNIPCLYLKAKSENQSAPSLGSSKLLIYFHANAEDIGLSYSLLDSIRNIIKINVIAPEYPGYGIYNTVRSTSKSPSVNQTINPSSE